MLWASFYAHYEPHQPLGVQSIDVSFVRAAYCLGANGRQVSGHVIVPRAMPFIFTGLQISVGVAGLSLVAGEMVSGQYGLGYLINTSYTMVQYPSRVIMPITIVGYCTIVYEVLMRYPSPYWPETISPATRENQATPLRFAAR